MRRDRGNEKKKLKMGIMTKTKRVSFDLEMTKQERNIDLPTSRLFWRDR